VDENRTLTIKEMPPQLRPREKLLRDGVGRLTDAELLALLMGTGNPKSRESVLDLAHRILAFLSSGCGDENVLRQLLDTSVEQLCVIAGVGVAKASSLVAAAELGRRISAEVPRGEEIGGPEDAARMLMADMRYLDREHFRVILLNTKHQVLGVELVSIGGLDSSAAHPREIFKQGVKRSAAAVILAHNHPSGDPTPSGEDVQITRRLVGAGEVLGMEVLDHIIIGDDCYVSLRRQGTGWHDTLDDRSRSEGE